MPTMKGIEEAGGSTARHRQPASEYTDATVAQKREYWRTKKREQRARLSERRGKLRLNCRGEKLQHRNASSSSNPRSSGSKTASPLPPRNNDSRKAASPTPLSGRGEGRSQKEKWFQKMKLNKVLPQFPASTSRSAREALAHQATVRCLPSGTTVSRPFTSPRNSGAPITECPPVPAVRVKVHSPGAAPCQPQGRLTTVNGDSSKLTPQLCVSMQGIAVPKAQRKAQLVVRIQAKPGTANVTPGIVLVSSPSASIPFKVVGRAANTTPQAEQNGALVNSPGAKGAGAPPDTPRSEEERAAKRREQWRLKKREQRAKLAAQLAKTREKTSAEQTPQRRKVQRAGQSGRVAPDHLPSPLSLKVASQRRCVSRVKTPPPPAGRPLKSIRTVDASTSPPPKSTITVKEEMDNLDLGAVEPSTLTPSQNQQAVQVKVEPPPVEKASMTTAVPDVSVEKKSEQIRKLPIHILFSNAARGISRCRMPRQRFIEAQRSFLSHRRNAPSVDPSETPEQTAARRREYWRVKKREQRAKLSAEVKAKLKERDSMMRRVKRYQKILEEIRRAKAGACGTLTQPTGTTLTHASETIGGFIKEDGTVTIHIPQLPSESYTETSQATAEVDAPSDSSITTHPQRQPQAKAESANRNAVLGDAMRVHRPPPPLHLAQVKVSFPLASQSAKKPPRLLSVRSGADPESTTTTVTNSHRLFAPGPAQITLTRPESLQGAISGVPMVTPSLGGCVMKMAVSSSAPSRALPPLDPQHSEEDRMAKKREYWRIKKREQRAARAARLKQGALQARGGAALQRRKLQRLTAPQQKTIANCAENSNFPIRPHSSLLHSPLAAAPQTHDNKDEKQLTTADDLNSRPVQAICPDIKGSPSHPPLPEPDPALGADSQATTLLAVASMKKLLEESLITVTECKDGHAGDLTGRPLCGAGAEEFSEQEVKPDVALLSLKDEEKVPTPADVTLDIKGLLADADALMPASSPSPLLSSSDQTGEILSLLSSPSEGPLPSASQQASQASSVGPAPPLPHRARRLRAKKVGHQHCCPPESPKLHHVPSDQQHPQQVPGPSSEQNHHPPASRQSKKNSSLLTQAQQQRIFAVAEQSGMSSLQKKREYWRLMKRQQRARSRARQKDGVSLGEYSLQGPSKRIQAPNLLIINTPKRAQGSSLPMKPPPQPSRPTATFAAVTGIPTLLVVSPSTSGAGQSPDTLQVKPPVSSVPLAAEQTEMLVGAVSQPVGDDVPASPLGNGVDGRLLLVENQQEAVPISSLDQPRVRKWTLQVQESTDSDTAPSLPTLTPPDNPLSSINLLPIEPLGQTPDCRTTLSSTKFSYSQPEDPQDMQPPAKLVPVSTMVPPKPIPGEPEQDFLKRKREYWRVKKKEQRARKAMRDRELTHRRASNNWRLILPANGQLQAPEETQDSGHSMNLPEECEQFMSTSSEAEGYFAYSAFAEDRSDVPFTDYDDNDNDNEEGPVSDTEWRNRYLMDHDPLNQLLVCMVCGELQYSHSVEGVRAHIEETHPETLNLGAVERSCILEAWDEQVSQRERFFTSQLQQHSGAPAGMDDDS